MKAKKPTKRSLTLHHLNVTQRSGGQFDLEPQYFGPIKPGSIKNPETIRRYQLSLDSEIKDLYLLYNGKSIPFKKGEWKEHSTIKDWYERVFRIRYFELEDDKDLKVACVEVKSSTKKKKE